MGRFFSDPVERALKYIYYDLRSRRGQEGFQLLQQAVQNGDSDACCLLARCLYGPEYTWPGHNFPVDEQAGDELMRRSVLEGSAIGTLLSLRCGVMNRKLAQAMPLSFQEAFDTVLDKAEHGEPLCQMIIGNAYYWGDFPEIQGKTREDFDSDDAIQSYLRENYAKCEDWLWRSLRSGISTGGVNLANFYREGKTGLISPRPEKAIEVYRYGAEKGYPSYLFYYANELYDQDIQKLCRLTSESEAEKLQRLAAISSRIKPHNEKVYYIIDGIQNAILESHQIQFQYYEYTQKKERILKHDGYFYKLDPYALEWKNDHYYLIGYSHKHHGLAHFRVDRLAGVEILESTYIPQPDFDVADYTNKMIDMFASDRTVCVELLCENRFMKTIVDDYGETAATCPYDSNHFVVKVEVNPSGTFYGWVFKFMGGIKIIAPQECVEEMVRVAHKFL